MDSHKTVSTNHNLFEEKGEPKRYRTEILPLTSLTPYRLAKPAHVLLKRDLTLLVLKGQYRLKKLFYLRVWISVTTECLL